MEVDTMIVEHDVTVETLFWYHIKVIGKANEKVHINLHINVDNWEYELCYTNGQGIIIYRRQKVYKYSHILNNKILLEHIIDHDPEEKRIKD